MSSVDHVCEPCFGRSLSRWSEYREAEKEETVERGNCKLFGERRISCQLSFVQIPLEFAFGNKDVANSWELPKYLATNKATDRFFTHTQFACAVFHVEGLALWNHCCIHQLKFHDSIPPIVISLV